MKLSYKTAALLVTWFGAGRAPFIRGTFGSLAALPFAYVIQITLGNFALLLAAIAVFILGCRASRTYLRAHPEKDDPGEIVIDEVAGQFLILAMLFPTWHSYLAGFILFRAFDILKPWPVSWADRRHGWCGVMLDDLLAGAYPALLLLTAWLLGFEAELGMIWAWLAQ